MNTIGTWALTIALMCGLPSMVGATTHTAATCSPTDVNAVINSTGGTPPGPAADGDTIIIPAGTCDWTAGNVTITNFAGTIQGASPIPLATTLAQAKAIETACNTGGTYTCLSSDNWMLSWTTKTTGSTPLGLAEFKNVVLLTRTNPGLTNCTAYNLSGLRLNGTSQNVRVHHSALIYYASCWPLVMRGNIAGVIDHNTILSHNKVNHAFTFMHDTWGNVGAFGDNSWATNDTIGQAGNLFAEDNAFFSDSETAPDGSFFTDHASGSRHVIRFNLVVDGSIQSHGTETSGRDRRGPRHAEYYRNKFQWTLAQPIGPTPTAIALRGVGTSRNFDNILVNPSAYKSTVSMNQLRADPAAGHQPMFWGRCLRQAVTLSQSGNTVTATTLTEHGVLASGTYMQITGATNANYNIVALALRLDATHFTYTVSTTGLPADSGTAQSPFDGNTDSTGWPCLDQPGRGKGVLYANDPPLMTPLSPANQAPAPMYSWNNSTGTVSSVAPDGDSAGVIIENRDYYNDASIGIGLRSARPSTCTTGKAYWSTDGGGNWNTSTTETYSALAGYSSGADGALDLCSSTNTWTNNWYVPYTYPHPLIAQTSGDTTAPTAPSSLTATAPSATQINLSWAASTDNVGVTNYFIERCQGVGCSSFVQVTSTAGLSLIDTGLTASTTYQYRVRATDAAGNLSAYSNTASATTPALDTTPPTTPTNLTPTTISKTEIDLTWTASTDNVAVSNYQIFRCVGNCVPTIQLGTAPSTSYADLTAVCSTTYSYGLKAVDTSNNVSALSGLNIASTFNCLSPPLPPSGVTLQAVSDFSRDKGSWSWSQGVGSPADGYHVNCGKSSGIRTTSVTVPTTTTLQLFVRQFLPGQGLWFCGVTAFNAGGDSTESAEVSTNVIGPGFGAWGFSY